MNLIIDFIIIFVILPIVSALGITVASIRKENKQIEKKEHHHGIKYEIKL